MKKSLIIFRSISLMVLGLILWMVINAYYNAGTARSEKALFYGNLHELKDACKANDEVKIEKLSKECGSQFEKYLYMSYSDLTLLLLFLFVLLYVIGEICIKNKQKTEL